MTITSPTQVGHEKNKFIIRGNFDGVQWPQECANCGRSPTNTDNLSMSANFKGGRKNTITVLLKGIPYCEICYPKINRSHDLSCIQIFASGLFGVFLCVLFIVWQSQNDTSVLLCGASVVAAFAIGYGLSWLLVKQLGNLILKSKLAEPLSGNLKQDPEAGNVKGVRVVMTIPRIEYASKFAELNNAQEITIGK
jgi:hypothetical protein